LRCTKIVLDEEAIPTHLLGQYRQFGHSLDVDEAVERRETVRVSCDHPASSLA
jgi:hypothetical protein